MVLEEIRLLDKPDYPIFFMLDNAGADARAAHLSVEERTQICKAFCDTVDGAGYTAGIYAPRLWIKHYLILSDVAVYRRGRSGRNQRKNNLEYLYRINANSPKVQLRNRR